MIDRTMTLELRYKREILRWMLFRGLDPHRTRTVYEAERRRCMERIAICWENLDEAGRQAIESWIDGLPEEMDDHGIVPQGVDEFERASGDAECSTCGLIYYDHPVDPRETFALHVSCDGRRWKL